MADGTAFFYGTLMAPGVLYRVIYGSAKPMDHQKAFLSIQPALLQGFSRHRVRYADYPGITPLDTSSQQQSGTSSTASVLGTFVTGLTPMDVKRLDTFEGSDYERRKVKIRVLQGSVDEVLAAAGKGEDQEKRGVLKEVVETQTYVFLDKSQLEDVPWDFEQFKKEKLRFWTLEPNSEFDDLGHEDQKQEQQYDGTRGRGITGAITAQLEAEAKTKEGDSEKGAEIARSAV